MAKAKQTPNTESQLVQATPEDGFATQIMVIDADQIIRADWNYKDEGTQEEINKLAESIKRDRSAGVLPVRETGKLNSRGLPIYESVDGNHRVPACLDVLKWPRLVVENFGEMPIHEAILIAKRRNHNWFKDNNEKLSVLFRDFIIPNVPMEDLLTFMPDTEEEMAALLSLSDTLDITNTYEPPVRDLDENLLGHGINTYLNNPIKQLTVFFKEDEFKDVVKQIETIMLRESLNNNTDVIKFVLGKYFENEPSETNTQEE